MIVINTQGESELDVAELLNFGTLYASNMIETFVESTGIKMWYDGEKVSQGLFENASKKLLFFVIELIFCSLKFDEQMRQWD